MRALVTNDDGVTSDGIRALARAAADVGLDVVVAAAAVARTVIPWALDAPDRTVLNVNVPDVTEAQLRGLRRATLATFGAVQTHVTEVNEGYVEVSYRDVDRVREPGTDTALLADGW